MKTGVRALVPLTRIALLAVALMIIIVVLKKPRATNLSPSFEGDSTGLHQTQIVPTLDTPIEPGKNVLWCATFQAAWKDFQNNVVKAPVQIESNPPECALLNAAPDPTQDLTQGEYYVASGKNDAGASFGEITADMKRLFPDETPPDFSAVESGYVLFSFLKTQVHFTIPYFENDKPLVFTDSSGVATKLKSFGIRPEDQIKLPSRFEQVNILYTRRRESDGSHPYIANEDVVEFALDLCKDSRPNQIVVACIPREKTLAETLDSLEKKIAANKDPEYFLNVLVPEMLWHIAHHYRQLEGKSFLNADIPKTPIGEALQEIQFRLDRSGAEVWSKMKGVPGSPEPAECYVNKPFLLYIKTRGAAHPFFVLWIDNAELLQKWN